MNICFLSKEYPPNIVGGVGTYTYEMAQALTKIGHSVHVITEAIDKEGEVKEEGIYVNRVKAIQMPFLFFLKDKLRATIERLEYSYAVSRKLKQIVKRYKIDIVESCEARFEGFWYYLFHNKPPLIVKLHTPESIVFKLDLIPITFDNRLKDILEEWWIFRADRIIPVTAAIAKYVSNCYKIKLKNTNPVYYPIDANLFKPNGKMPHNTFPIILYAGRLEVRKGVQVLLEAIPLVLKEYPDAHFYFVGADAGIKYLMDERITELGCSASITFIGQVKRKEMVRYYHLADVCVFPSIWENFAFVSLEAMACGKAIIASKVGGFLEMIDDGISGVFCNPGDSQDLALKIAGALKNKILMKNIGEEARKKIVNNYSAVKRAVQMTKIYEEVL